MKSFFSTEVRKVKSEMVRHFVHTKPAKSEEKYTKNETPKGLGKRGVFESLTTIKRQKTFMSEQEPSECFI